MLDLESALAKLFHLHLENMFPFAGIKKPCSYLLPALPVFVGRKTYGFVKDSSLYLLRH